MRYAVRLAYRGTHYNGWQKQVNARGVQSVLDDALSMILNEPIETLGCGRTDTGVHAEDFVAHFDVQKELDTHKTAFKLSHVLPKDIAVFELASVPDTFNARFDALSRTYEYRISAQPNPFGSDLLWFQYGTFNIEEMNKAAQLFIGKKDFEAFSKVHTQVNNFVCDVTEAYWEYREPHLLVFTITANRFLRNMVRAIVGTLVDVGRGKRSIQDVQAILASKDRCEAGQSVPAHGLFLTRIQYPQPIFATTPS